MNTYYNPYASYNYRFETLDFSVNPLFVEPCESRQYDTTNDFVHEKPPIMSPQKQLQIFVFVICAVIAYLMFMRP